MKHKMIILFVFVFMIGLTGCQNVSNEKNEKIHDDIPADKVELYMDAD